MLIESQLDCLSGFDCDFSLFDANSPEMGGNSRNNFEQRMRHIRDHILYDGSRPQDRIVDGFLVEQMKIRGMIDEQAYREWLKPSRVPPILGSGRSGGGNSDYGNSRRQERNGLVYLKVVEEEAGPSRYHKKKHTR